jgi:tetratricopeptide (TPR) repeat protein
MDKDEPGNWYIYKEWGITFKECKDYDKAIKKLQKALEFTKSNKNKSDIYTELGEVYRENNMVDDALVAFERAENIDRDNAILYEKWAYLYSKMGQHHEAMNKMAMAKKLDENNEIYVWKFEYYAKKFAEPNFSMGIGKWLELKRNPGYPYPPRPPEPRGEGNNPHAYNRFRKRYRAPHDVLEGTIIKIVPRVGVFVGLEFNVTGLIFARGLPRNFDVNNMFEVGQKIKVKYRSYNDQKYQIGLALAN